MSTPARPSTPIAQTDSSAPQTGTWRHPKMDEIVRRQNASSFEKQNLIKVAWNLGGIVSLYFLSRSLWNTFPSYFHDSKSLQPYASYGLILLYLMFVVNIAMACMPLYRGKDDMSDIPLTPAQRKLMGLPPSSAAPTPGSQYITPPRYARTPNSMSGSSATKPIQGSPLSNKGSPFSGSLSGSPFSPIPSPLLQKAIGGGNIGTRRHSYGSPSPLGTSKLCASQAPGTPSPASKGSGTGTGIGLSNKWLFDKSRRNSGNSSRLYT